MKLIIPAIAALLSLCAGSMPAHAKFGVLSAADTACLKCHAKKDISKTIASNSVSLHVTDKRFSESVHNDNGCTDCHTHLEKLDIKKHEKANNQKIGSREYSIASVAVCKDCHKKNVKQYDDSLHAGQVREGNAEAPICSDCHDPHYVREGSATGPIADVSCRDCHGKVFKAYAGSVHGVARDKQQKLGKLPGGENKSPICADCHKAHEIKAAAAEGRLKDACLGCHKNALAAHKSWLPNSLLHFEAVSCPACHVTTAKRRVDLRLYDTVARKDVTEQKGVPRFESRLRAADAKGLGIDALALQSLLKEFNHDGPVAHTVLRGRLEVSSGIEAHQLVGKDKAIKDCNTCHRKGADVFQSVAISIARPDGRTLHHDAQTDVLTSTVSVDSIKGFYAIGGTRIQLLDVLFVVSLVAGFGFPVGHVTLKWLTGRYLLKLKAQEGRHQAPATGRSAGVDEAGPPDKTRA